MAKDIFTTKTEKIVIIGAGFAGTTLAKKLAQKNKNAEIIIIDKKNYFLFTPLLHEVATGSLSQRSVIVPIRNTLKKFLKKHHFIVQEITKIDTQKKKVHGKGGFEKDYDKLFLAMGSKSRKLTFTEQNYFELKTLEDAKRLKNQIIDCLEKAQCAKTPEEKRTILHFVVIGGGPTGVELAAEIAEFVEESREKYYSDIPKNTWHVTLVHGGENLVQGFDEYMQQKALEALQESPGITVLLKTRVKDIREGKVELENGEKLSTQTPIVTAGIEAMSCEIHQEKNIVEKNRNGQILVNGNLNLPGDPDIFILGDMACRDGMPQTAQAAEQEATYLAAFISKGAEKTPPFEFKEKGQLISLGKCKAAAAIFGIHLSGFFAWWIWRTIYLSKIGGFWNKFQIVTDWTIRLFSHRDITKL